VADIFNLFDGGAVGTEGQHGSSFSDIQSENDLVARLASGTDSVDLKVDYSDFENFVTFNSAESYVTITADQILNEYPFGGTVDDLQGFFDSIDGYQRYFLSRWPSRCGHLRLDPAVSSSYVKIDDFGVQDGVTRSSFVSPGTGSLSIQGWIDVPVMTGSNDVLVVFQKLKQQISPFEGISVFVTGSSLLFNAISGSTNWAVSGALTEMPMFFSAVIDRNASTVSLYTATTGTFPTLADSTSATIGARFDLRSGSFYIGSGSDQGGSKVVRPFTGSIDYVSVWSTARGLSVLTSSYNRKIYAQSGLLGAWRFNEATQDTPSSYASIIRDCSGHRLDGRIQSYFSGSRGSGSLTYDSPDPILSLEDPDVVDYLIEAQGSGALYDRDNQTLIWRLFPEAFTQQDPVSSDVFKNFALIMARSFDRIKLHISQLVNLRRVNYGDFDQAPDEFLEEVGESLGWDLQASFIDQDALRYFLSRDVTPGVGGNIGLDTRLADIKSQFWKRMLLNLLYIYKTKGTRESVEALLRTYGINNGFVRLKEYARKSEARMPTQPVLTEKSFYTLTFVSGSSVSASSSLIDRDDGFAVEIRTRFPGSDSDDLIPTKLSGSIWTLSTGTLSDSYLALWYEKPATTETTGNLFLTSSAGRLAVVSASIFNERFYNISVVRETTTGSLTLSVVRYEQGELVYSTSSFALTGTTGCPSTQNYTHIDVGSSPVLPSSPEFWAQEFRIWQAPLNSGELLAHAQNFMSYGRDVSWNNRDLRIHWRFDDAQESSGGSIYTIDSTSNGTSGTGSAFVDNPYTKFLDDYSYIPSIEYGWNQQKIRSFSGSWIDPYEAYTDENIISLEYNMYDALNEDISNIMTSYDELNIAIGLPISKYRFEYERLQQMRETYFKRLQGDLKLRTFIDMMDFFDVSFVKIVERILPARAIFKGDEMVIESHMLERPKYQYGVRPIREGTLEVSGTMALIDRDEDWT
jgi:hypothetical protein